MMNLKLLQRNDLNLLVTFSVLLEEESVSRSAERLFLTQPAVSKSLARLREMFDDPLFTRVSKGLVPTPLAEQLRKPVQDILNSTCALFDTEAFDPATYQGEMNFIVSEVLDMAFMPLVFEAVNQQAPGLVINTRSHTGNAIEQLENGKMDFVINLQYSNLSDKLISDSFLTDTPVVMARKGHPLEGKVVSLEDLQAYSRVSVHFPDINQLLIFQERGQRKDYMSQWPVAVETENFITALSTISRTDNLLLGPGLLGLFSTELFRFSVLKHLEDMPAALNYSLISHQRTQKSDAHQWLRKLILQLADDFRTSLDGFRLESEK